MSDAVPLTAVCLQPLPGEARLWTPAQVANEARACSARCRAAPHAGQPLASSAPRRRRWDVGACDRIEAEGWRWGQQRRLRAERRHVDQRGLRLDLDAARGLLATGASRREVARRLQVPEATLRRALARTAAAATAPARVAGP